MSGQSAEIDRLTEREDFIAEHYSELTDALLGMGIEDADHHDGFTLADTLYCHGWRKVGETTTEHQYRVNRSGKGNNIVREGMTLMQAKAWLKTDLELGYGPLVHIEQRERQIGEWSGWTDLAEPSTPPASTDGGA